MLKLKELKAMVPETGKMDRVPTYKKLRESGHEIVVKEVIDQDTEVMVYDNGLVVYRNFRRITIFPLHTCNSSPVPSTNTERPTIRCPLKCEPPFPTLPP